MADLHRLHRDLAEALAAGDLSTADALLQRLHPPGDVPVRAARVDAALRALEEAERLMPLAPSLKVKIARLVWERYRDVDHARAKLDEVSRLEDPRSYAAHMAEQLRGLIALEQGDLAAAAFHLLGSLGLDGEETFREHPQRELVERLVDAGAAQEACRRDVLAVLARLARQADSRRDDHKREPWLALLARLDRSAEP